MIRYASLCLLLLISCGRADKKTDSPGAKQGAAPAAASPASPRINYAHGFTIDYFDHYKEVKILSHSAGSADTLDYLLLPAGIPVPKGHAHAQVIRIPVRSMIVTGSTH